MATKWMRPQVGVPHTKRKTVVKKDWATERRIVIMKLRDEGKTTEQIRDIMRTDHSFEASIAVYKTQFKLWGSRRRFNERQRRFIIHEAILRSGRMPTFKYKDTNEQVDTEKLKRLWDNRTRHSNIDISEGLSPAGLRISEPPSPRPESKLLNTLATESTAVERVYRTPDNCITIVNSRLFIPIARELYSSPANDASQGIELLLKTPPNRQGDIHHLEINNAGLKSLKILPNGQYSAEARETDTWTDEDIRAFVLRILNKLGIKCHSHWNKDGGGDSSPIPSFDEWEKSTYSLTSITLTVPQQNPLISTENEHTFAMSPLPDFRFPDAVPTTKLLVNAKMAVGNSDDKLSRPFHCSESASCSVEEGLSSPRGCCSDGKAPIGSDVPDSVRGPRDCWDKSPIGSDDDDHSTDKPDLDLASRAAKLLKNLLGTLKDMEEIDSALKSSRSWRDLNKVELGELHATRRELADFLFRLEYCLVGELHSPQQLKAHAAHLIGRYGRLLGIVAIETLEAQKDIFEGILLSAQGEEWAEAALRGTFRAVRRICGADHASTRGILSTMGFVTAMREFEQQGAYRTHESLVYQHLALNGRQYLGELPLDCSFDVPALEALYSIKEWLWKDPSNIPPEMERLKPTLSKRISERVLQGIELSEFSSHDFAYLLRSNLVFYVINHEDCLDPELILSKLWKAQHSLDLAPWRKQRMLTSAPMFTSCFRAYKRFEKGLEFCNAIHGFYTEPSEESGDMSRWTIFGIDGYIRNLGTIAAYLTDQNDYSNSLRVYERVLDCRTRYNYFHSTDSSYLHDRLLLNVVDNIVRVLTSRGPVLYAQPLLNYIVEKGEHVLGPLDDRVVDWILLSGSITLKCSGLATDF